MRRVTVLWAAMAAALLLCACGRADSARDVETLRMRVERLERESADDRAKTAAELTALREELDSLRASLDEASRHLAELSGQEPAAAEAKPHKSPRADLKASLHGAWERSRQALDRLGRELDRALTRKSARTDRTEKSADPAEPETKAQ
jgi:DNA repair exonuclease SbcCD ATPase subunit